jgi:hypothetical protein
MSTEIPSRAAWKRNLAPCLEVDRRRSLGQIAGVVMPYLAIWIAAALIGPSAPVAIGLGLLATVFLSRMYSLFHDLTRNSMFESRRTNSRWGHFLPPIAEAFVEKYGTETWHFVVRDGAFSEPDRGGRAVVFRVRPVSGLGFRKGDTFSQTTWRFHG